MTVSPRVRRWLLSIGLWLLVGFVTTAAVAWGCAVFVVVPGPKGSSVLTQAIEGSNYTQWQVQRLQSRGAFRVVSVWQRAGAIDLEPGGDPSSLIPAWADMLVPSDDPGGGNEQVRFVDGRGWPWFALRSGFLRGTDRREVIEEGYLRSSMEERHRRIRGGLELSPRSESIGPTGRQVRILPLIPIWSGLLPATLLYGTASWLVFLLLRSGWRTLRLFSRAMLIGVVAGCGAGGVLTALGMAWALAAWSDTYFYSLHLSQATLEGAGHDWSITRVDGLGRTRIMSIHLEPAVRSLFEKRFRPLLIGARGDAEVPTWAGFLWGPDAGTVDRTRYIQAFGWPLRCLWSGYDVENLNTGVANAVKGIHLDPPPTGSDLMLNGTRTLPLGPIWGGLFVDGLLFALGWFLLVQIGLSPITIRRFVRRRLGRCPACGYDLRGGSGACPECGDRSLVRDRPQVA